MENRAFNMDCMEAMRSMPDQCFDLAVVDPPYGIKISNNMGRRKGERPSEYKKVTWDPAAAGILHGTGAGVKKPDHFRGQPFCEPDPGGG